MDESRRRTIAEALRGALVAAFPGYAKERIAALGAAPHEFADAIEEGSRILDAELGAVLADPPAAQRRAPLEVFRDALAPVTAALAAAGVPAPDRDLATVAALPDDRYDLGPASSTALGDAAWRAHVAWGIAKAEAVAGVVPAAGAAAASGVEPAPPPAVVLVGTDLMDRATISNVVAAAGLTFDVWRNPAAVEAGMGRGRPALVLVDLTHRASDAILRRVSDGGVRVVAFGPHVDDFALVRARALGASDALPRSRFFRTLPDLLPKQA